MLFLKSCFSSNPDELKALKNCVDKLEIAEKVFLKRLICLLQAVIQKQEKNLMTLNNIATIFAPILFEDRGMPPAGFNPLQAMENTQHFAQTLEILIEHFSELFVDVPDCNSNVSVSVKSRKR